MAKLQNIKAVRELVDGTHKIQNRTVVGWEGDKEYKIREVGEVWEEKDATGKTVCWWTQMDGWRRRSNVDPQIQSALQEAKDYVNSFPNCQKEVCTCTNPNRIDIKFRQKTGMCEDCVMSMETKLKIAGKFNEYAINKMKANAESFFNSADVEVRQFKESFDKSLSYLENSLGAVETWEVPNPEAIKKQIDIQYNEYKKRIMDKLNENL